MNKQAKKAKSRIWSHYGGQILSREAFTTFGGFSDIVDPIIQQAIDAALAEQGAGLQGLVDAAEIALADYKAAYIVGETVTQKTVDRTGRIEILKDALSTFRAGKPTLPAEVVKILREVEWTNYGHRQGEPFCPWCRMARSCGHAGDCEYAALLAPYRKEQEDVQPN